MGSTKQQQGKPEQGPTRRELVAIEGEWPWIAAELAVVEAEIVAARTGHHLDELSVRRVRREQSRRLRSMSAGATGLGVVGGLDGAA